MNRQDEILENLKRLIVAVEASNKVSIVNITYAGPLPFKIVGNVATTFEPEKDEQPKLF